jgi:hypothetical protein
MTAADFRKIVEPELNRIFTEVYSNHCKEWEAIYGGDDGVALRSTAHPGSESITQEDIKLAEEGGWKCVNGHPYCNRCASSLDLSEKSLERMLIEIKDEVDRTGRKIALDPTEAWFIKPEHENGLKRFERKGPLLIKPGRRWWE